MAFVATPEQLEARHKAKELFLQGMKPPEIAAQLGVRKDLVYLWSSRGNWSDIRSLVISGSVATRESREKEGFYALSQSVRMKLAEDLERVATKLLKTAVPASVARMEERAGIHQKLATAGEKIFGWKETDHGLISLGEMRCVDAVGVREPTGQGRAGEGKP